MKTNYTVYDFRCDDEGKITLKTNCGKEIILINEREQSTTYKNRVIYQTKKVFIDGFEIANVQSLSLRYASGAGRSVAREAVVSSVVGARGEDPERRFASSNC